MLDNPKISHMNVDQLSSLKAAHCLQMLKKGQMDILIMVDTSVNPSRENTYARTHPNMTFHWNSAISTETNSQNYKGGTVIVHKSDLLDSTSFIIQTNRYLSHLDFELVDHAYRLITLYGPASSEDRHCQPLFHKVFSEECIDQDKLTILVGDWNVGLEPAVYYHNKKTPTTTKS